MSSQAGLTSSAARAKRHRMPPISEILPGQLCLGAIQGARDHAALRQLKNTHAVSCAANRFSAVLEGSGVEHALGVLPADPPNADIQPHFERCTKFIRDARESDGRTFVFCHAGQSRSVTIALAFLMAHGSPPNLEPMLLKGAFRHVYDPRPIRHPNPGFRKALFNLFALGTATATHGRRMRNGTKRRIASCA
jgi:hypothetical protein